MASFLLQCNICPKHPHFSDLSHLLTHVGSKGHLSHYFKAQVRSRQEPAVREQLRVYDHWYQVNQVEKLLSQRMILKDSKNAQNKSRATDNTQRPKSTVRTASNDGPRTLQQQAPPKEEDVIDPQLTSETYSAPQASVASKSQPPAFDPASASREYIPRMQGSNFTTQRRKALSAARNPEARYASHSAHAQLPDITEVVEAGRLSESPDRHVYPEPPVFSQPFDAFTNDMSRSTTASRDAKRDAEYRSDAEVGEIEELDDITSECTKLKGVCWPGMDIFDSASPDGRRKRNQKKDGSTFEQMKANSAVVEPTELIFYSGGELKKRRYITGKVESSPIQEESPKPKRQRIRSTKASLSNLCANVSRSRRELHFTKSTSTNSKPPSIIFQDVPKPSFALDDSLPITESDVKHRHLRAQTNDELDWALLIGDTQHGKKRAFEVHNEEPEKRQHISQARAHNPSPTARYPFLQDKHSNPPVYPFPHGLPYPSSGYSLPHLAMTSPAQVTVEPVHRKTYETRLGGNRNLFDFSTINNKENIEPIMDDAGRIDNAAAAFSNGRSTQRYFAMQGNGPPHYYTSMPPHLDFAALQPSQPQCFSLNPLTLNFGQSPAISMPYSPWPRTSSAAYIAEPDHRGPNTRALLPGLGEDSGDETIDEEAEQDPMLPDEDAG